MSAGRSTIFFKCDERTSFVHDVYLTILIVGFDLVSAAIRLFPTRFDF